MTIKRAKRRPSDLARVPFMIHIDPDVLHRLRLQAACRGVTASTIANERIAALEPNVRRIPVGVKDLTD